jgi:hypothetical protein
MNVRIGSFGPPVLMTFTAEQLATKGLKATKWKVRDLFLEKDEEGTFGGKFAAHVPTSAVKLVKVTAA